MTLISKLNDADPDFRFMSLNDLLQVLTYAKSDFLHHDYNIAARTVDNIVKALDDQNGEVQNLAIKWYVRCYLRPHTLNYYSRYSITLLMNGIANILSLREK